MYLQFIRFLLLIIKQRIFSRFIYIKRKKKKKRKYDPEKNNDYFEGNISSFRFDYLLLKYF